MFYKFIKIRGSESGKLGYYIPRMYKLCWSFTVLKMFGFSYIKERLTGWTIWWVSNEKDYNNAIKTLKELKKTHEFDYMVSKYRGV